MRDISITINEHRSLKFVASAGKVAIFDIRYERITPGNPQMHQVGDTYPVYVLESEDARELSDFLASAV